MNATALPRTVEALLDAYRRGELMPRDAVATLRAQMRPGDPAWIHRCDDAFVDAQLQRLTQRPPQALPLYGIPFAVKDNIDVEGLPTTAACPAFTYVAGRTARAVQRLLDAGAVLLGKTNLDQFATGLVGTRSPYGEVPNAFDAGYVSGGSSSGSASVVARGLVPFALGTDTAGSGRVPAGFNNLVGLKPTPGLVSTDGVLPACRTLDCLSVFALTAGDAARILAVMEGTDGEPVFHRAAPRPRHLPQPLRVGVPRAPEWHGDTGYAQAWERALDHLRDLGASLVEIDMQPLFEVARLLYDGPWVAERYAVVQPLIESQPQDMDATVRRVIEAARGHDAVAAFRAQYRLKELELQANALWRQFDMLMVPTAPTLPTRAAVAAAPVERNSELGRYTNFVNLLGQAAIAVPAGFTGAGLPFGVTFVGPGGSDAALCELGARWQAALGLPLGAGLGRAEPAETAPKLLPASEAMHAIAVVGAHLAGMPLHGQLSERGARLLRRTRTSAHYRLYALAGTVPPKPGLARSDAGAPIEVEVYEMPQRHVGSFLALVPPPLGLGTLELEDGSRVQGFICEPWALQGAQDITRHGGWRAYLAHREKEAAPS